MIVNESHKIRKINEAKTIDLGGGSAAYQYGGKYYIKKGDSKKEISSDEYSKLLSKGSSKSASTFTKDESDKIKSSSSGTASEYFKYVDPDTAIPVRKVARSILKASPKDLTVVSDNVPDVVKNSKMDELDVSGAQGSGFTAYKVTLPSGATGVAYSVFGEDPTYLFKTSDLG